MLCWEKLLTEPKRFWWKSNDLRILLLTMHHGISLPFCDTFLCGRSCTTSSRLLLSEVYFSVSEKNIGGYAKAFTITMVL